MYALLGIDTILRITAALALLFVAVPALARPRPRDLDRMEWFWWCFAAGIVTVTIAGQILTFAKIFSALTILLLSAAIVLVVRAHVTGIAPTTLIHQLYRAVVLFALNVLEGRVSLRRRWRRMTRRWSASLTFSWQAAGWTLLILVAAAVRFYRPFATANLGFSDTYVHLYLVRLLEEGKQVDPAWGPYPRGLHFLLAAIRELTNVDAILLMNFFGPVAGVLMTIAVADTARRLSAGGAPMEGRGSREEERDQKALPSNLFPRTSSLNRHIAALFAGLLFATMTGGATQYFLFGGSIATDDPNQARAFEVLRWNEIPHAEGEFDVLMTVFQRQTATLPQELAIVFLFPAAMFLLAWLRTASRWHLSGFAACTAAIAAVHPGVAVPLVVLSAVTVAAARARFAAIRRAMFAGAIGIALGSTWMLGFIAYPYLGTRTVESAQGASSAALYYFPLLRGMAGEELARIVTWVAITPFLLSALAVAAILLVHGGRKRDTALLWIALATFVFFLTHVASRWGLPEVVEVRRNASWLAMTVAILFGVAVAQIPLRAFRAVAALVLVVWFVRVPLVQAHQKLIEYSGYSTTARAVLDIQRLHEPFSWTLVTYGQEFPMVLGKGFHLSASDFLDRYDPAQSDLTIPTKYIFIAVEKNPHPFQINTWTAKFSRADVEQRLQTWCFLYQLSHRDMRVFREDEDVRVYVIERTDAETNRIAQEARQ